MSRSGVILGVLIGGVAIFAASFLLTRGGGATAASSAPRVAPEPPRGTAPAVPQLARAAPLPRRVPPRHTSTSKPVTTSSAVPGPAGTTTQAGAVGTGSTPTPSGSTGSTGSSSTTTPQKSTGNGTPSDVTVGGGSLGSP